MDNENIIPMFKMKPLQVGVIVGNDDCTGEYVMRTCSVEKFEVILLTDSGFTRCWTNDKCDLDIRLLGKDEKLALELSNN